MRVGIVRETHPGERRVAATPESVRKLLKLGFDVVVEEGAGDAAGFLGPDYEKAGATVEGDTRAVWAQSDVVLKVRAPGKHPQLGDEVSMLKEGATLIGFLWPAQSPALLDRLKDRKVSALSMDMVPRITRAQKMDALSSMANIAGYRAVIEAAHSFGRFFTGQITAAGKVPPAKVMVIGAGVAGLAALGAARGLGAVVRAFDTRPAVKEQVQSMGAEFLELRFEEQGEGAGGYAKVMSKEFIEAEMALFRAQCKEVDIIITTALIPGKKAPVLITKDMLETLATGSVVVDLAAEQGGNCELTEPGQVVLREGVTIIGYTDLPSRLPAQSSTLYSNNLVHLLEDMGGAEAWKIDLEDEVVRTALVTHEGEITYPPPRPEPPAPKAQPASQPASQPAAQPAAAPPAQPADARAGSGSMAAPMAILAGAILLAAVGVYAPQGFIAHLTVFVLAVFIGWQVVWRVTPALHTPLMSVTNAISGIIVVGGMLHQQAGREASAATILGAVAILVATINVAGGFLVTHRMLRMFRK